MMQEGRERQKNFLNVCSGCVAECCHGTRPPITSKRKRTIKKYLREHGIDIRQPFVAEDYVFPREQEGEYCIFHDKKTGMCIVHSVKPETCVAGPITFDINKKTGKIEWFLKKEQICRLAGAMFRDKEMLSKHTKSAKEELSRLVKELDAQALKAILKKDEPETFKISEDEIETRISDEL
jgi:Fe-S-cluster containining protein